MSRHPEPEVLAFADAGEWEAWLERNHDRREEGVWVRFARKGSGLPSVTYAEAVDGALAYGWIDGQVRGGDERHYLQRFTPRRKRSRWSKVNREKVARLTEAGRMRPSGLREVERAEADGRWGAAYDPPSTATPPEDFLRALEGDARAFFEGLDGRNRYGILYDIQDARRPETRARRIEKYAAMMGRREKPYP